MDERSKFYFRVVFAVIAIGGAIFLTYRYLWKGSPFIKVMALGLIAAVTYLVINFIKKKQNN